MFPPKQGLKKEDTRCRTCDDYAQNAKAASAQSNTAPLCMTRGSTLDRVSDG